jgi:spermidine synthase
MSHTSVFVAPRAEEKSRGRVLLAGIALSSFAALLLELGLTRLFSVVLFYHFAFLAISIALLGLGAGGVFAHLAKRRLERAETRALVAQLMTIEAAAIPCLLELVLHVPVSLDLTRGNFLRLTTIYLASAIPFCLTGIAFSVVFARESSHIPRLYGADLSGGAAACLAIVPLLNWLGGPNTILFAALMAGVSAWIWSPRHRARNWLAVWLAALVVLIVANHSGRLIDIVYAKGKRRDAPWVEFARWNAISRVEVDDQGGGKAIVIDADASTYIMNADPNHWQGTAWETNLMSGPPALANVLRPHGKYAIIGPGGGVDILRAVANGSPSVTGIEINPIIANTIMRGRYADYSHHLYERPGVQIEVRDGRSFLRNSKQTYDVVQMTLVDTWASTAAGAFALSENNLYTLEAFEEYFQHLGPDGIIAITRWEFRQPREALRVVSEAMEALHQLGVANPARNFIVVSQGKLNEDGRAVVVIAKKTAFTPDEEKQVRKHLTSYPVLDALYLPSVPGNNPFSQLIARNDAYAFARDYAYNVTPVDDNTPFFFFTLKLGELMHPQAWARAIDWKVNLGVAVLGAVLIISVLAVLAFLIVPLAVAGGGVQKISPLLYFVAVGLGYILVEIAFIQRFVLFLGHPTYALTVVVFLLLLSSGIGSLTSRKWLLQKSRLWLVLSLIAGTIVLYVLILPGILNALVGLPFVAKLLVSAVLLVPLGFLMGMPFPTGLRALAGYRAEFPSAEGGSTVEWAWAMNAASSVLGSVLAMVLAIRFGMNVTLACGAAAYLLAWILLAKLAPSRA